MKALTLFGAVVALGVGLLLASPAQATDRMDLWVGLKAFSLLNEKIAGPAVLAIVYDPANVESEAEANTVKAIIDAGLDAPWGVKLSPLLVPTNNLGKLSETKLAFVTKGGCTDAVSSAAASNSILTMSTDLDCVKSGRCIIGVVSKPRVEIYFSSAAAEAAKIGFSQAFSMLAKQV